MIDSCFVVKRSRLVIAFGTLLGPYSMCQVFIFRPFVCLFVGRMHMYTHERIDERRERFAT